MVVFIACSATPNTLPEWILEPAKEWPMQPSVCRLTLQLRKRFKDRARRRVGHDDRQTGRFISGAVGTRHSLDSVGAPDQYRLMGSIHTLDFFECFAVGNRNQLRALLGRMVFHGWVVYRCVKCYTGHQLSNWVRGVL